MPRSSPFLLTAVAGLLLTSSVCDAQRHGEDAKFSIVKSAPATTPIKRLMSIFDENISFDHYFGTYPNATNPPGGPPFFAYPDTPAVNGLTQTSLQHYGPGSRSW